MEIREVNGKKVRIESLKRPKFKERILMAKENIDYGICGIGYDSMPDLNKEVLDELKEISKRLEEISKKELLIPFDIK